jgi:hypothetical protein
VGLSIERKALGESKGGRNEAQGRGKSRIACGGMHKEASVRDKVSGAAITGEACGLCEVVGQNSAEPHCLVRVSMIC